MESTPIDPLAQLGERQNADESVSKSRRPHRAWIAIAVCVGYLIIACLIFLPTGPLDATQLPGGGVGDPDEMTWFLAWTPWALFHGHNFLITHAIDVPGGVNLANNTSVPLLGILASPITTLLGPIATFNVLLRLALATSGAATFFLTRRWCRGDLGPILAGALFAFSPALVSHLQSYGHLDLVFLPLIPLCVWLLEEILVIQRRSPVKTGAALAIALAGEYLISAELFADFVLLAALGVVVLAALQRHLVAQHARYVIVALSSGIVIFAALIGYPVAMALVGPNHLSGPVQSVAHLQRFRTDLAQLIIPDNRQWLFPSKLSSLSAKVIGPVKRAGGSAELGGYIGAPLLITALVLAVYARKSAIVMSAFVMALASLVLSLGSRLQIDGRATAVPLPEAILAKLPLLDSIVPARFSIFVMLALVVIVAKGVDDVAHRVHTNGVRIGVAPTLCALGLGASLVSIAPHLPVATETSAESASEAASIAALVPTGSLVLTYPYADPPFARSMLWQATDNFNFTMLGGYANIRSATGAGQLYPLLVAPNYVQEFLTEAAAGRRVHYPATTPVSDPTGAICAFIAESHVTSVLYAPYGPGAASVYQLFVSALGKPSHRSGAFALWDVTSNAACGQSAH
jgi:hypothetical protein